MRSDLEEWKPVIDLLKNRTWRLNNLYAIQPKAGKKIKFRLNWAQREVISIFHYLNFILKVRQLGISTLVGILMLDECLFKPDRTCGIIDQTDDHVKRKIAKILFAWENLDSPDFPETRPIGIFIKDVLGIRLKVNNKKELEWTNGSKIWGGTTMRGSAVNFLHVTELGYIAVNNPGQAEEIISGSFNAVGVGNLIVVETTHEGGRYGASYDLCRMAMANEGRTDLGQMEWKFLFLPWWKEPTYRQPVPAGGLVLPLRLVEYFEELDKKHGIKLADDQKHWYALKEATPKIDMKRQYPSHPEEALQAFSEGSIYGEQMAMVRATGRIRPFTPDQNAPMFTFWDIGQSDFLCIWTVQFIGREIHLIDYLSMQGATPGLIAARLGEQQKAYKVPFKNHFLPHDAGHRGMVGKTYVKVLEEIGLFGLKVVPKASDVWIGIKHARAMLPRCVFNSANCDREIRDDQNRLIPSGIACLEGYRKAPEGVGGTIKEMPVHDAASHGADAFRTMAEADLHGMIRTAAGNLPAEADSRRALSVRTVRAGSIFPGQNQVKVIRS